eukprot:gene25991-31384_t
MWNAHHSTIDCGSRNLEIWSTHARTQRIEVAMLKAHDLSVGDHVKLAELRVPIAKNERQRLKVLRQTSVMSGSSVGLDFDSHVSLLSRVLKAPMALVTFVDVNAVGIKSKDAPSILVIPDVSKDSRFLDNPLHIDSGINFYAGAALTCRGVRLGAVCIFDCQPRSDFDERKQAILFDMASIISSLIDERMIKMLEQEQQVAKLIIGTHFHLLRPIRELDVQLTKFKNDIHTALKYQSRDQTIPRNVRKGTVSKSSVQEFRLSVQRLVDQVEVAVNTAVLFVEAVDRLLAKSAIQLSSHHPFTGTDAFYNLRRLSRHSKQYDVTWDIHRSVSTHRLYMDRNILNKIVRCLMELAVQYGCQAKISVDLNMEKSGGEVLLGDLFADAALELNVTFMSSAPLQERTTDTSKDDAQRLLIAESCEMLYRTLVSSVGGECYNFSACDDLATTDTTPGTLASALLPGSPGMSVAISLPCVCRQRDQDCMSFSMRSGVSYAMSGELSFVSRCASNSTCDDDDCRRSISCTVVDGFGKPSISNNQARTHRRKGRSSPVRQPQATASKQVGPFSRLVRTIQAMMSGFRLLPWKTNKVRPIL